MVPVLLIIDLNHTDLSVFSLRFRLSAVCEYLNHKIANDFWAIPEKKPKQGGLRTYFLEKNSKIFRFVTLHLEILDKTKLYPCKFREIVLHPLEIPRPKMKTLKIYGISI